MFAVIYSFEGKESREKPFIESWETMTLLIR